MPSSSKCHHSGPEHPRLVPERRGDDPQPLAVRRKRARRRLDPRGLEQQVAAGDGAASDDDERRVERVDDAGDSGARAAGRPRRELEGVRVSVMGELGDEPAGDLLARREPPPERRVRALARDRSPVMPIARPEARTSRQPRPGQPPGQSSPWMSSTRCPSSPGESVGAAIEAPAEHEPAADTRAERDHHAVVDALRRPVAMLGEHGQLASLSTSPAGRAARSSGPRSGTSSIGRWFDQTDSRRAANRPAPGSRTRRPRRRARPGGSPPRSRR